MRVENDHKGPAGGRVRVFLLSAYEPARRAIRDLLEHEGMEIAGESASAEEAVPLIRALRPDVAVLDAKVPDGDGIEVSRRLREAGSATRCVVLTSHEQHPSRRLRPEAAVAVFVLREISGHNLPHIVRQAAITSPPEAVQDGSPG